MTDIDKLRKLLAAAPPTPWVVQDYPGWWQVVSRNSQARPSVPIVFNSGNAYNEYTESCLIQSRDLIVAAVNALPELLGEIERLSFRVQWIDHFNSDVGYKMNAYKDLFVEIERLKAELREAKFDLVEAMELLRAHGQAPSWFLSREEFAAVKDWNRRYGELLAKYKETT